MPLPYLIVYQGIGKEGITMAGQSSFLLPPLQGGAT
jgi:hypothetical protein